VHRAVILGNARVSRRAAAQHAIVDKNVTILEGATGGVDKEHDRARGLTASPGGVTVTSKRQVTAP
jgi:glucose-1-phosphate adenylyltransferase